MLSNSSPSIKTEKHNALHLHLLIFYKRTMPSQDGFFTRLDITPVISNKENTKLHDMLVPKNAKGCDLLTLHLPYE